MSAQPAGVAGGMPSSVSSALGRVAERSGLRAFRDDEGGFTALAVMLAVLLAMTILAVTIQVYWVNSSSADIQDVADAGALAGANVLSKAVTLAAIIDATSLAVTIVSGMVAALGAIISMIPYINVAGPPMVKASQKINEWKNKFITDVTPVLDGVMKAAPFLAAADSAMLMAANSHTAPDGSATTYLGLAIPLPVFVQGSAVSIQKDTSEFSDAAAKDASAKSEKTQKAIENARKAAHDAEVAAVRLGGMQPAAPVETWEPGLARDNFWRYYSNAATEAGSKAAQASAGSYDREYWVVAEAVYADFARLLLAARPDQTMQGLPLKLLITTNPRPVVDPRLSTTTAAATLVPDVDLIRIVGAITRAEQARLLDYAAMATAVRLWKGLEAADKTKQAIVDAGKAALKGAISQLRAMVGAKRLSITPPGRDGVICVVVDGGSHQAWDWAGALAGHRASIAPRIAISAAMLAAGKGDLIGAAMSNAAPSGNAAAIALRGTLSSVQWVLTTWSGLKDAVLSKIEDLANGVGSVWLVGGFFKGMIMSIHDGIKSILESLGLDSPAAPPPIPVLVNTAVVWNNAKNDSENPGPIKTLATKMLEAQSFYRKGDPKQASVSGLAKQLVEAIRSSSTTQASKWLSVIDPGPTFTVRYLDLAGGVLDADPAVGTAVKASSFFTHWSSGSDMLRGILVDWLKFDESKLEQTFGPFGLPIPQAWKSFINGGINGTAGSMDSLIDKISTKFDLGETLW